MWVTHFDEAVERAGLDPERGGFTLLSSFAAVVLRIHPGDFAKREATLDRLVQLLESYTTTEGDALFNVNALDVAERPPGAERPLLNRLLQWGTRLVVRYWFKAQIDPNSHAVVFALPDGGTLDGLWPEGRVRVMGDTLPIARALSRHEFTGTHDPTVIFLAAGGPIALKRAARGHAIPRWSRSI